MVGGRLGEASAQRLAAQLREAALPMARLKTGTPPRLDGRTIDWARLDEQPSDAEPWTMSPLTHGPAQSAGVLRDHPHQRAQPRRSFATICIARRCSPARSGRRGRAIARRSRTRSTASPTATGTRSSSSPKGSTTHLRLSQRDQHFAARRRATGDAADDGRARAGRDGRAGLRGRVRPHRSARARPGLAAAARSRGSTAPARSTAPPATRKRQRKACSPECTRPPPCWGARRRRSTAATATSR